MFVNSIAQQNYNRFMNLDSITDRIINYLIKSDSIYANRIWKLLKYPEVDALLQQDLTQEEKAELVDNDSTEQSTKRVFRYPFIEDSFVVKASIMRIYIDTILPQNHLNSVVNVGFDLLNHNKLSNVYNDSNDELENPLAFRPVEQEIMLKSRQEVFLKNILAELNGADIEGVGVLVFDKNLSPFSQAKLGYFNNKNYTGYQLLMACMQSGVA